MDLRGPLPATKSGHTWIVTWVDRTSKTIVAAAAKEGQMSFEALALMTFRDICCRFRLPLHLIIDNDAKFVTTLSARCFGPFEVLSVEGANPI